MSETPLPNDPAARTETGELKDQAAPLVTETTTSQEAKPNTETESTAVADQTKVETKSADGETSLLNEGDKKADAVGAPEKYEAFTVPEGFELNTEVADKASTLFKTMNLSQAQAQELVNFYSEQIKSVAEAPYNTFNEVQADWRTKTMADPTLGPRIAQVKGNIGRALDSLGDAKLTSEFKSAMDLTGAGNHPAFVKAFDLLAQRVIEGKHVSARGPSPLGQTAPGAKPASIANALYPNLP